jgi:glycosyltransferase involved in cell wall biosynthesis
MTNTFETGGSERQLAILAKSLNPERFQVHVGCIRRYGPFAQDFQNSPEFRLGGSLYGWQSLRARMRLARYLRKNRVQIAHAFEFYTTLTLVPAARLARVPLVIGSFRQLGDLMTPAQFRAQALAFRWCDAVVCNSKAGADWLAADGLPRQKLHVIGNALPDEAFMAAAPALLARPGVMRVGMVARMNAGYKNHAGFLRIATQIHRRFPEVEFVLAGDGPLRSELEQQAKELGLAESVIFLGDRRDVSAVLRSMDVAVLTSESEGLSNVILEAMAAGVPVVAYDVGGNRELVNVDRGAIIPPADENGFALAVGQLLTDPALRRRVARNARAFAEENFSLKHILNVYEDLYQSLLKSKGLKAAVV